MFPRHLQRAIRLAETNTSYPKWRICSVLIKGGSVLSVGQSRLLSDPAQCDFEAHSPRPNVSVHSEIAALRGAPRASGGTLHVARIGRNGKVAMAKPCRDCREAIAEAGIKRVVYTVNEDTYAIWSPKEIK